MAVLRRLGPAMTAMAAIIALLLLADVAIAAVLVANHSTPTVAAAAPKTATGHPCNHGYYVSKAAHAKKGGKYVSSVAKSNLGKDGNCSKPLP